MATLQEQIRRLEKLSPSKLEEQLFKAVREAENLILRLNKEQVSRGEDIEGSVVGTYAYSTEGYADADGIHNSDSKQGGRNYNFYWHGNFVEGFRLESSGYEAIITSDGLGDGGKKAFLLESNVLGLNDDNLKRVIQEELIPNLQKFVRTALNL